jgi:signal transduction histidine kinase
LIDKLVQVYKELKQVGKKMDSASKFIDFFVHDILDYSVLMNNSKAFRAENEVFDIREGIKQISRVHEDSLALKKIDFKQYFVGFNENGKNQYLVKTDIKRMQQVLLNLVSNAIKFTPPQGKVVVLVEKLKADQIMESD